MTPSLQLYDNMRPGLDAGTYTVEAEHSLDVDGAKIPAGKRTFAVQGPRFTLPAGEIHSVYPPANAVGPFAETLAHVVLATRTLPWERELMGRRMRVPWLALLVFDANEIPAAGPTAQTGAVSSTVDALLTPGDGGVAVPAIAVTDAERKLKCQTLEIPLALFQAVAPRAGELRYLAHVRQIDLAGQPGADADEVGWFAVVVASRLPVAAKEGARNIAHLVSVEGHEARLPVPGPPQAHPRTIRLVSLASWSFSADSEGTGESFEALARGLAAARPGERQDLSLGLPFDDAADGAGKAVADRLADGYVPIAHRPSGRAETVAWYRGPLVPRPVPRLAGSPHPLTHPRLLPVESVRFFHVDRNWTETLVDGAVSVGVQSSRDSWFQELVRGIGPHAAGAVGPPDPMSGFVMRSALVAGWPALTVEASAASGEPPALLRSERLAPDVLLCLFAGVPGQVRLRTPHQSLHFALEGNEVRPRQLSAPVGTLVGSPIAIDDALHRAGADRVIDVSALVRSIDTALGTTIGPADLALQLLYAPEEMTFTRP